MIRTPSPHIIRVIKSRRISWAGHVARVGRRRIYIGLVFVCVCVFVWKPEAERSFGRLKFRWEGNIKTYVEEIGLEAINFISVVQSSDSWRAVVVAEMKLHGSNVKFLTVGNREV